MGRVIVITGAGQGLGHCITKLHLDRGDVIYALDNNITGELKTLAEKNSNLKIYQCDVSSGQEVNDSLRDVLGAGKRVDILYNVAGIFSFSAAVPLAETDIDECIKMFNVNALGAMRMCKALFPLLQEGSVVLNVSSEAGSIGAARRTHTYGYCMSKAAMNMMGKILSNELWAKKARVMMVYPGWMRTRMGGPASFESSRSVSPEESAEIIVDYCLNINDIPRDQMFMSYTGYIIPW